ncbi:MAG: GNAT family N-acetyltransferase [Chloroflexota bacterium]
MIAIYRWLRVRLGYWLDRFAELCDRLTVHAYGLSNSWLRRRLQAILQGLGGYACVLNSFPRVDAYRLVGPRWVVIYVGVNLYLEELQYLFFPEGVEPVPLGRVPVWRIAHAVQRHLSEADLVVCGLGQKHPRRWLPKAPYVFTCPVWVNQVLDISRPLENLLRGRARRAARRQVNAAKQAGFEPLWTRDWNDFERFFHHMYVPHIRRRHGSRARLTTLHRQWRDWLADQGELLLLKLGGRPVAGLTVRFRGTVCFLGEEGVDGREGSDLFRLNVQTALKWFAVKRAKDLGMECVVMGGSLARYGDPVFTSKRQWGAPVVRRQKCAEPEWTFVARAMPESLAAYLDSLGLISFVDGKSCVVQIAGPTGVGQRRYKGVDGILWVEAWTNRFQAIARNSAGLSEQEAADEPLLRLEAEMPSAVGADPCAY